MKLNLLRHLVDELQPQLSGARISKIHQPEADLLVLRLWTGIDNLRLLISVKPGNQRLHLTSRQWLNPHQPPRFCQLLRSRISRIERICVINNDRVVQLQCSGPKGETLLIVEMLGASGNLILTDDQGVIIDVLKRDSGQVSGRPLLAGRSYVFPEKKGNAPASSVELIELPDAFSSWSEFCEQQSVEESTEDVQQGLQQRLRRAVIRQQKKLNRRLQKIHQELSRQEDAEQYKIKGDLLLAHLQQIQKGMEKIVLTNIFSLSGEDVEILLDTRLLPQQNAQNYFTRYKKANRGVVHSQRRLEETESELQWLDTLLYQLDEDVDPADLESIHAELDQAGLLRGAGGHHKKRTRQGSAPQALFSPSGIRVLRGRNNRHNDLLSGQQLKKGDLWFHAYNCPGAHVVLKSSAESIEPTTRDIHYAATIAAGYSRARHDARVEVMMATAENVARPKGVRPGLVTVKKYKTLIVEPFRPE